MKWLEIQNLISQLSSLTRHTSNSFEQLLNMPWFYFKAMLNELQAQFEKENEGSSNEEMNQKMNDMMRNAQGNIPKFQMPNIPSFKLN